MIEIVKLTVYGNKRITRKPILNEISAILDNRSVIIGPNGSGKTSLLKAIMGLIDYEGSIRIELNSKPSGRAIINSNIIDIYKVMNIKVKEIIGLYSEAMNSDEEEIIDIIKDLRISHILDSKLTRLSTGESKLLGFAMALGLEGNLVLLDEPFENLDISRKEIVVSKINQCNKDILIVTHDLQTIKRTNLTKFYLMISGKLEGGLPIEQIDKLYINLRKKDDYLFSFQFGSRIIWISRNDGEYPLFSFNSVDELIGDDQA